MDGQLGSDDATERASGSAALQSTVFSSASHAASPPASVKASPSFSKAGEANWSLAAALYVDSDTSTPFADTSDHVAPAHASAVTGTVSPLPW